MTIYRNNVNQYNHRVDMVWHNAKCAQYNMRIMFGQIEPCALCDLTKLIQYHFAVDDLAKYTFAPMRHDGDIIRARLGIIVSLQSNGMTVVNFGIKFHGVWADRFFQ